MQDTAHPTPPIFILSSARSGSTLLRYIVDTHPDICCPGELNLGALCEQLYWTINDTLGQVAVVADEKQRSRLVLAEVRRIVSGLMETYARAKRKRLWCEKSPMNLVYLGLINEVFPDAKYICLYRNCMDVVHSCLEFTKTQSIEELTLYFQHYPQNRVGAMIRYWLNRTEILLDFERSHRAQCFGLKYESLVSNTDEVLRQLFAFLTLEWDTSLLSSVFVTEHEQGDGDPKIRDVRSVHKNSLGQGARIPLEEIPGELLAPMNAALAQLSYPLVGPESAATSGPTHPGRQLQRRRRPSLT